MRPSGPIFTPPKLCQHCQRRRDHALGTFTAAFRAWLRCRRAAAVDEARSLATLPINQRRRVRAAQAATARAEIARRIEARRVARARGGFAVERAER